MYRFETPEQLKSFIASEVVNTSEATLLLGCTRQNIDDLARRGKLAPIKTYPRDKLFLRADVLARLK
ncbi:MAG: DNA-binding protein [Clostridiales bacterium]|jgi:hypothetical protein|nr:DNA-binding protein [Clostridiales bacterium]